MLLSVMETARPRFDGAKVLADATARGWDIRAFAVRTKPRLHPTTIRRFVSGEVQTTKTAGILAKALGYQTPRRYLLGVGEVAA